MEQPNFTGSPRSSIHSRDSGKYCCSRSSVELTELTRLGRVIIRWSTPGSTSVETWHYVQWNTQMMVRQIERRDPVKNRRSSADTALVVKSGWCFFQGVDWLITQLLWVLVQVLTGPAPGRSRPWQVQVSLRIAGHCSLFLGQTAQLLPDCLYKRGGGVGRGGGILWWVLRGGRGQKEGWSRRVS